MYLSRIFFPCPLHSLASRSPPPTIFSLTLPLRPTGGEGAGRRCGVGTGRRTRYIRLRPRENDMKLNYGWIVVGAGMVATGVAIGTIMALGVFLQPTAVATG